MTSRMKRMLHRRKDNQGISSFNERVPNTARSEPALRMSLYDTTASGGSPQTGEYPIRGNDRSATSPQQSHRPSQPTRQNSTNHYERSPTPDQYRSQSNQLRGASPPTDPVNPDFRTSHQFRDPTAEYGHNERKRLSQGQLAQDFSNLHLGRTGPTTVTQTVTTTLFTPSHSSSRNASKTAEPSANNATIRSVAEHSSHQPYPVRNIKQQSDTNGPANHYASQGPQRARDEEPQHQSPIPRKKVGSRPTATGFLAQTHRKSESGQGPGQRPLPAAPAPLSNTAISQTMNITSPEASMPVRSTGESGTMAAPLTEQAILDRARTDTNEIHVTETYSPAVVHETVNKNVHHVREELVTRETHNHDVFHRALPIVDVEVLPPRHFLPVEGGGLVEIGAEEVPGRGNNWIIAETASKIPSDQAAPAGARRFTARTFSGDEGDAKRYITPEGYERTEQTWVHPPELETGARDTGQSWPMVFGDDVPKKGSYVPTSSMSSKKKRRSRQAAGFNNPIEGEA